jgi:GMP synthase-like glutamine amidotransferase
MSQRRRSGEKEGLSINGPAIRLLVLNHRGVSLSALVERIEEVGVGVEVLEPESIDGPIPTSYDGFIASGGYLRGDSHRETLRRYSDFFEELERPFLGVCLGMKILGYCYGARIVKVTPVIGERRVRLDGFPLCPDLSEFTVHQNHRYELIQPLPKPLQDYTADPGPVQAVKVKGKDQYAVQFHPEVGESASVIVRNFVSLCAGRIRRTAQGT